MNRRNFTKLFPLLFMPLAPGFAERNKPAPLQSGIVSGVFDENGAIRLPIAYNFPTLPRLVASPTGGYFSVNRFEAVALTFQEGAVSATGEPNTPCAFTWVAVQV